MVYYLQPSEDFGFLQWGSWNKGCRKSFASYEYRLSLIDRKIAGYNVKPDTYLAGEGVKMVTGALT